MSETTTKRTATAKDLKAKPILIDVPGTEIQLECRRPDPFDLFLTDALPLPIYGAVIGELNAKKTPAAVALEEPHTFGDLVDRWVCAAVVNPRVVLTKEEGAADDAVWVEDLEPLIRWVVFTRTADRLVSHRVAHAVQEFREQETLRARAGSDGPAVRVSPEPVLAHA